MAVTQYYYIRTFFSFQDFLKVVPSLLVFPISLYLGV